MTVVLFGLLVELLAAGAGPVPKVLAGFWEPIPHTRLPCSALRQEKKLSPTRTWYAMLCLHPWKACLFLNKNRGVDGE